MFSNIIVVGCLFPSSLICYQVTSRNRLLENDIIDEVEEKPIAETEEVKLRLEFEREERRLEHEERRLEWEGAQSAREEAQKAREAVEAEAQRARDLRLAELKEAPNCVN